MIGSIGAVPREPQPADAASAWVASGTKPCCFGLIHPDCVQRLGSSARVQHRTSLWNTETQLPCFQGTLETLILVLGDRISSLGFCILRHIFWPQVQRNADILLIHIASVTNMWRVLESAPSGLGWRVKWSFLNILIHWLFELTSSCGPTGLRFDPYGGQHFLPFFLVYRRNYPFLNIKTTRVLEFSSGLL